MMNSLIIEDASLELLPSRFLRNEEVNDVSQRFGVSPAMQILDRNYHPRIVSALGSGNEKRGRPDVVHFALLDATSTPLFQDGGLRVFIHTIDGKTIEILSETRLPRTLERFCGVMSKLLSGHLAAAEEHLFRVNSEESFEGLIGRLRARKVITLSSVGRLANLVEIISEANTKGNNDNHLVWVIGGFPSGDFKATVFEHSDLVLSISSHPLTAHVVVARLCYELERKFKLG